MQALADFDAWFQQALLGATHDNGLTWLNPAEHGDEPRLERMLGGDLPSDFFGLDWAGRWQYLADCAGECRAPEMDAARQLCQEVGQLWQG